MNPKSNSTSNNINTESTQRKPNEYLGCWKSIPLISHPTYAEKVQILPSNVRPFAIGDLQPDNHFQVNLHQSINF